MTDDRYMEATFAYPPACRVLEVQCPLVGGTIKKLTEFSVNATKTMADLAAAIPHRMTIRNDQPGATRQVYVRGTDDASHNGGYLATLWPGDTMDIEVRTATDEINFLLGGVADDGPQVVTVTLYGEFAYPTGWANGLILTPANCIIGPIAAQVTLPAGAPGVSIETAKYGAGATDALSTLTPVGMVDVCLCHRTADKTVPAIIYGLDAGSDTYGYQLLANETLTLPARDLGRIFAKSGVSPTGGTADIPLEILVQGTFMDLT